MPSKHTEEVFQGIQSAVLQRLVVGLESMAIVDLVYVRLAERRVNIVFAEARKVYTAFVCQDVDRCCGIELSNPQKEQSCGERLSIRQVEERVLASTISTRALCFTRSTKSRALMDYRSTRTHLDHKEKK